MRRARILTREGCLTQLVQQWRHFSPLVFLIRPGPIASRICRSVSHSSPNGVNQYYFKQTQSYKHWEHFFLERNMFFVLPTRCHPPSGEVNVGYFGDESLQGIGLQYICLHNRGNPTRRARILTREDCHESTQTSHSLSCNNGDTAVHLYFLAYRGSSLTDFSQSAIFKITWVRQTHSNQINLYSQHLESSG